MKSPLVVVPFAVVALSLLSACAEDKPTSRPEAPKKQAEVRHVDGAGAAELLAGESAVTILDVRTPAEFAAGHLKDAVNIDFKASDFKTKLEPYDRAKTYLVHCRSGGRSTNSLPIFKELGFTDIVHLDGGFLDWEKAGQPVEK